MRGHNLIKNLNPRGTKNYNCLEACIRLHLSSIEDPNILAPANGEKKYRYNHMMLHYPAFQNVQIKLPPFEDNLNEYSLSQFSQIENANNISLVVYMLYACNNDKKIDCQSYKKRQT